MKIIEAWFVTFRGEPVSFGYPTKQLGDTGKSAMNAALRSADLNAKHHPHTNGDEWGAGPFQVAVEPGRFILAENIVGQETEGAEHSRLAEQHEIDLERAGGCYQIEDEEVQA